MTYHQILNQIENSQHGNSFLRKGQICFNLISEIYPVFAEKYRGTEIDPYYDDSLILSFLDKAIEEGYF